MKLIETKRKAPALIAALLFGALISASCSNSTSEETDGKTQKDVSVEGVWKVVSEKKNGTAETYPKIFDEGITSQPYFYWAANKKGYFVINISGAEEQDGLYKEEGIADWGTPYTVMRTSLIFGNMKANVTTVGNKMTLDAELNINAKKQTVIFELEKTDKPTPEEILKAKNS